jgi:membrane dipeptidase
VNFTSSLTRALRDHGEFGQWLDGQMRSRHLAVCTPWTEDPEAASSVPTADDWAAHAPHVIETAGPDHVGIGLDLVGGRSCVLKDASGYPDLIAALERITTTDNVTKIAGQNWLRVLEGFVPAQARPARKGEQA